MDYYAILEVKQNAGLEDIKRSFRRLAKKYHPDVCPDPDAQQKFTLVYTAYDILQDPFKRRMYDDIQSGKIHYAPQEEYTSRQRYDDWRRQAYAQADTYSSMQYDEFEDSVLGKISYHGSNLVALVIFFLVLCAGITFFMFGSHYVFREDFNGSKVLGYLFWGLGAALSYTGGHALYGIFDHWKR